jgi:hypothetical protein
MPEDAVKPIAKKRLALKTETLRSLSDEQLVHVGGAGFTDISGSCSCNSCICSYFSNCGPVVKPATGGGATGGGAGGW